MYKIKTSYYYLERGFPENLEPAFTNRSTKRKRFLVDRKKRIIKRAIRKSVRTLVKPFFSAPTRKGLLLEKTSFAVFPSVFSSVFSKEKTIKTTTRFGQANLVPGGVQSKCKRYKFLFPLHRLKGELTKRESQYGKIELYKKQIQEKKKLAFFYGSMSKNSVKKLVKQARALSSAETTPAKGLVTLLESRLDVALFRASFFSSIPMARQWINHNRVTVNKNKVRAPSYQLRGGDCIEILPTHALPLKENIKERIVKILPFRRSRKKLVTGSLIENWCSFEKIFSKENLFSLSADGAKSEKILTTPSTIQNFSLIRDHLQSIWEKSVHFSVRVGERLRGRQSPFKAKKGNPLVFSQPKNFPAFSQNQRNQVKALDKRSQGARKSPVRTHPVLEKGVALFGYLRRGQAQPVDFLKAKQALVQTRNRMQKLAGLQVSSIKPLHLEVSYKLLTAIFLYSPQKIAYPGSLDLSLIIRSFR